MTFNSGDHSSLVPQPPKDHIGSRDISMKRGGEEVAPLQDITNEFMTQLDPKEKLEMFYSR